MASQNINVDASRSVFNHIFGNQYNITTTNTRAPLPPLASNEDDQVYVPLDFNYYGDGELVKSKNVLLDAKITLGDLNEEGGDLNEDIRVKLGK
jgi:hypothetical protein